MNKRSIFAAFLLSTFWSGGSFANICYTVEGEVETKNVSAINQSGTIKLVLLDESDNEAFRVEGPIFGTVTGFEIPNKTILSHQVLPTDGNSFITTKDIAQIVGIRKVADNGEPCSFYIKENISNIAQGSGFFSNVSSVDIVADGYISACFDDLGNVTENENEFELAGSLCVSQ